MKDTEQINIEAEKFWIGYTNWMRKFKGKRFYNKFLV